MQSRVSFPDLRPDWVSTWRDGKKPSTKCREYLTFLARVWPDEDIRSPSGCAPIGRGADETVPATSSTRSAAAVVGAMVAGMRLRAALAVRGPQDADGPSRLAATQHRAFVAAGVGRTDRRRPHGSSSCQWCSAVDTRAATPDRGLVMPPVSMACSSIGFMTAEHDKCAGVVRVTGGEATCECECHQDGDTASKPVRRTRRSRPVSRVTKLHRIPAPGCAAAGC